MSRKKEEPTYCHLSACPENDQLNGCRARQDIAGCPTAQRLVDRLLADYRANPCRRLKPRENASSP